MLPPIAANSLALPRRCPHVTRHVNAAKCLQRGICGMDTQPQNGKTQPDRRGFVHPPVLEPRGCCLLRALGAHGDSCGAHGVCNPRRGRLEGQRTSSRAQSAAAGGCSRSESRRHRCCLAKSSVLIRVSPADLQHLERSDPSPAPASVCSQSQASCASWKS